MVKKISPHSTKNVLSPPLARLSMTVLTSAGRMDKASQAAASASDAEAHAILAAVYVARGDCKRAKSEYSRALSLDRNCRAARDGMASLLVHQAAQHAERQRWVQAQSCLKEALEINPEDLSARRYSYAVDAMLVIQKAPAERLENAISLLEKLQLEEPRRADIAHQLALLFHQQAIASETTSKAGARDRNWEMAFGNWALTIVDNDYWPRWLEERLSTYGGEKKIVSIPKEEVETLRYETIPNAIKKVHQQYIKAYSDAGQEVQASRHQRLRAQWLLELDASRALQETAGMLEKKTPDVLPVFCGPIMWKHFGMTSQVAQVARTALEKDSSCGPAQMILEATTPVGLARVLQREGLLDEAIDMLEAYLAAKPPQAEGARQAAGGMYLSKAVSLAGSSLDQAFQHWEKAKRYGAVDAEAEKKIIDALLEEVERVEKKGDLATAERLLRAAIKLAPDNKVLRHRLVKKKIGDAVKRVNKAFQGFKPGENFSTMISVLDQSLRELEEAARDAPDEKIIQKHLSDLRRLRQEMEASDLNARAVEKINGIPRIVTDRSTVRTNLRQAEDMLKRASNLNPRDSTIKKNLETARSLLRQVGF